MNYLKEILSAKKEEIKKIKKNPELMKSNISKTIKSKGDFLRNIKKGKINIIAEIKKASPSRGIINRRLDVERTALTYDKFRSFISGISVLTESLYFKGDPEDISRVRKKTNLPVLRKDFIFSEIQVYESAALEADCILLISSLLGREKLKKLHEFAGNLGLDVLVEVHNIKELDKALDIGAEFIGINNRNLKNMSVDGKTIYDFLEYCSNKDFSDKIFVCESGIRDIGYIKDLFLKGINAFLIGEYFMSSNNLEKTLRDMELGLKIENLL
ncbi:MAG TPA: indole-3-glycerol-phosphate synthase [Candidatus Hydromicrobium sp.]